MEAFTAISKVFDGVITWIISAINQAVPLFYVAEKGLTFLGVLSVVGLSISVFFLLIGLIQNFLHLRG